MNEQVKRVGRPKSETKLTPSEKQAAYRQRCAARNQELQIVYDFQKSFYYQINYEIAQLEKNYHLAIDDETKLKNHAALSELVRFKMIMDNISNVTKTYKQVDIED